MPQPVSGTATKCAVMTEKPILSGPTTLYCSLRESTEASTCKPHKTDTDKEDRQGEPVSYMEGSTMTYTATHSEAEAERQDEFEKKGLACKPQGRVSLSFCPFSSFSFYFHPKVAAAAEKGKKGAYRWTCLKGHRCRRPAHCQCRDRADPCRKSSPRFARQC